MAIRSASRRAMQAAAVTVLAATLITPRSNAIAATSTVADGPVSYADAVPTVAPPDADSAPVYDQNGQRIYLHFVPASGAARRAAAPSATAASSCQPIGKTDWPHYSGGDVSGHGWWLPGNCTALKAHVYNALLEFYSDFTWRQKGESSVVDVYAGGGSGQRSSARVFCNYISSNVSWRNVVDVDVDGQSDPSDHPYSQHDVTCATEKPLT